jgi:hypothetical protein
MISRQKSWNKLQTDAKTALGNIQDQFTDLYERRDDENGWGQYLDPPPMRKHSGIYGTGSGIQVLTMTDRREYAEEIKAAQEWMIEEWTDEDSFTVKSGYRLLTYKHVFCLFGLSDRGSAFTSGARYYDDQFEDDAEEIFTNLWEKRIEGTGWGEWHLESDSSGLELQSSALAVMALLGNEDIRQKPEYEQILQNIGERAYEKGQTIHRQNVGNGNKAVLRLSFCLLALARYRNVVGEKNINQQTAKWIDQLGKILTRQLPSGRNTEKNTHSPSLISLPDDRPDDANPEHYMIFIVYPIVTLALLEAGSPYVGRNHVFIRNVVDEYVKSILGSDKNCFVSSDTGHCSTHDHLWIAAMLDKYRQTDVKDSPFYWRWWGQLRGTYLGTFVSLVVLLIIAFGAAFLAQPDASPFMTTISNLILALCGAALVGSAPFLKIMDAISRRRSTLL